MSVNMDNRPQRLRVFIDGELVEHVKEASEDDGFVVHYVEKDGKFVWDGPNDLLEVTRYGKVRLEVIEP